MITITELENLLLIKSSVLSNSITIEDAFESCIPILAKVDNNIKKASDLLQIAILRSDNIVSYIDKVISLVKEELSTAVNDDDKVVEFSHPWLSSNGGKKPKAVYESIQKFSTKYEDGNYADIDSTEIALMLSSIITHVLLDVYNKGTSHEVVLTYGLTELSDTISSLIYNGFEITDYTDIYNLLVKYKYLP